ncbi:uncharacterized protein LOC129773969 [Toxorhynchites rutilus septentrionalis]|uniref:uncharacterized protein LOC129773969 n=1 Tax=Toxorhynchites rutilus septentrionalis TaxID=329112 RepID=UPI002478A898|nr:uncharacterized protein LOC129773969 [Toxorhynchites rutilus septentrionalis]
MDDLVKGVVSNLFLNAFHKLQILSINPAYTARIRNETENYSIQHILEQTIHGLELIYVQFYSHDSSGSSSTEETPYVTPANLKLDRSYDGTFLTDKDKLRDSTRRLNTLKRLNDVHRTELTDEYCLSVSKNIFVSRWEKARLVQMAQVISNRHEELRESTCNAEVEMRSALEAAVLVDHFYTAQHCKVQQDCDIWMERFERELKELEGRLQKVRTAKKQWEQLKIEFEFEKEEIERLERLEVEYPEQIKDTEAWLENVLIIKVKQRPKKGTKRKNKKKSGNKRKLLGKRKKK